MAAKRAEIMAKVKAAQEAQVILSSHVFNSLLDHWAQLGIRYSPLYLIKTDEMVQAAQAKEEEKLDKTKFGTHDSITCDGCSIVPIVGYRWRCRSCKNHDLCDNCYESFKKGKLPQSLDQQRCNPVSSRVEDHGEHCTPHEPCI